MSEDNIVLIGLIWLISATVECLIVSVQSASGKCHTKFYWYDNTTKQYIFNPDVVLWMWAICIPARIFRLAWRLVKIVSMKSFQLAVNWVLKRYSKPAIPAQPPNITIMYVGSRSRDRRTAYQHSN